MDGSLSDNKYLFGCCSSIQILVKSVFFFQKNTDFKSIVKIIIKSSLDNGEKKWADIHLGLAIPISDLET